MGPPRDDPAINPIARPRPDDATDRRLGEVRELARRAAVIRRGVSGSESVPSILGTAPFGPRTYTGSAMVRTLIAALAVATAPAAADTLYESRASDSRAPCGSWAAMPPPARSWRRTSLQRPTRRTKANHGRALHVWRLDYGALNASGKALSLLTAHFRLEAEWPPCTNWTGLGQYPGPVQWAGSFETLQRMGGLEVGAEARRGLCTCCRSKGSSRASRAGSSSSGSARRPLRASPHRGTRQRLKDRPVRRDPSATTHSTSGTTRPAGSSWQVIRTATCGISIRLRTSRFPGAEAA